MSLYKPTDEDEEETNRAILAAAYRALGDLETEEFEESDELKRRILRAFVAANSAHKKAHREMKAKHGECNSSLINITEIVATAYCLAIEGLELTDDINPYSDSGHKVMVFSQIISALFAMSLANLVLDDDAPWGIDAYADTVLKMMPENE